jgi:hypothetical protein
VTTSRVLAYALFILPLFVNECPRERLYVVGHLHRYRDNGSGMMSDRTERIRTIERLGFGGTRLAFEWGLLEPERGSYRWAAQDTIIDELEAAGLGVYGMIGYSPEWARPLGTRQTHRPIVDGSAARGDTAFAAFAAAVARRYRGRIDRWEIWNEPNILHFWIHIRSGRNQGPDPVDYGALFRLASDSIRAANPDAVVSTAGLAAGPRRRASLPGRVVGYPDTMYLDSLLALGIRPQAVGVHPYTRRPSWLDASAGTELQPSNPRLTETLAVLDRYGLTDTPVWITEWGVDLEAARTETEAEIWFTTELHYLLCHPRVQLVTVYALADRGGGPRRFSLVEPGGTPTATGRALVPMLRGWSGC